jgi:hypothetical protein
MKPKYTFLSHLAHFFLEWKNVSDKFVAKINTHILCSVGFFSRKPCRLWDTVGKYSRAGQATDDNMAHAHCMLNTQGYKPTLRICNAYCFSTATMVALTRLDVTLYMHCLSCYSYVCLIPKVHLLFFLLYNLPQYCKFYIFSEWYSYLFFIILKISSYYFPKNF